MSREEAMNRSKGMLSSVAALAVIGATAAIALGATPNGDFESGDFDGWETYDSNGMMRSTATGQWQVYKGKLKVEPVMPRGGDPAPPKLGEPPQGTFAAGLSTNGPGNHILHRVLEADGKSELRLELAFQNTANDFYVQDYLTSEPPARGLGEPRNQQLRIDLLKPDAPIDTLKKSDIIDTIFKTKPGDKRKRDWKPIDATVGDGEFRLRIAEVDNEAPFAVGVDAVKLKKK
jgi:hypothetical protein